MKKKVFLLALLLGVSTALLSFINSTRQVCSTQPLPAKYKECIEACNTCASTCSWCASECLKVKDDKLNRCVQLCLETASMCRATSELMSLDGGNVKDICKICAEMCKKCKEECTKFSYPHCKQCAETCKKAEEMCNKVMNM